MQTKSLFPGIDAVTIAEILRNPNGVYEGNLAYYFKILMSARNMFNPYHNMRHMLHVLWRCYDACLYYGDELTPRQKRNLLIGSLFHDFDHSGKSGPGLDDLEIERAIRGLRKHILLEDKDFIDEISEIIKASEFPPKVPSSELNLMQQILRDADVSQCLSNAWIQQVFGLSVEISITPIAMLKMQKPFLTNLTFATKWGHDRFADKIPAKIQEAEEMVAMLE